jgi:hypothetical protein
MNMTLEFEIEANDLAGAEHRAHSALLGIGNGLNITNPRLIAEPDRRKDKHTGAWEKHFKYSIDVAGVSDLADYNLRRLIDDAQRVYKLKLISPKFTTSSAQPSDADRNKKLALSLGMSELQEKGLALSADPSTDSQRAKAMELGIARMKALGMDAPTDESQPLTEERYAALGVSRKPKTVFI